MSVEILTDLSPQTLLGVCKRIESDLGRKDSRRWGPRVIDIDLLLYGNENVKTPVLEIPHAKLAARRFVLVPLAEIADGIPVPGFGTTVEVLLERCPDAGHVRFYRKAKGVSE